MLRTAALWGFAFVSQSKGSQSLAGVFALLGSHLFLAEALSTRNVTVAFLMLSAMVIVVLSKINIDRNGNQNLSAQT
jgi:hypothetical protein